EDRAGDAGARRLRRRGRTSTRLEREPVVQLAPSVPAGRGGEPHAAATREATAGQGRGAGEFGEPAGDRHDRDRVAREGASTACRRGLDRAAYDSARRTGAAPMIGLSAGTKIWIVCGVTDMRKGFDGLAAVVQLKLREDPFSGQLFVFRGRRGD